MSARTGFVMIAALWLLTAIAASALQFGLISRSRRLAINNSSDRLILEMAASSTLNRLEAQLAHDLTNAGVDARSGDPWEMYAWTPDDTTTLDDVTLVVRIEDASSRLAATVEPHRLQRLFVALGATSYVADTAAALLVALRGEHDLVALPGCTGGGWDAGNPAVRNASPAVQRVLVRSLPLLLCAGRATVNVQTAPHEVLVTLPGVTNAVAAALIHRRRAGRLSSVLDVSADLDGSDRALFLHAVSDLLQVSANTTTALLVIIDAGMTGSAAQLRLEAVLTRSSGSIRVVWRRVV